MSVAPISSEEVKALLALLATNRGAMFIENFAAQYGLPGPEFEELVNYLERLGKISYNRITGIVSLIIVHNYKITAERFDTPEHVILSLCGVSERMAKEEFEIIKENPNYNWHHLRLVQFEEKLIETRNPKKQR